MQRIGSACESNGMTWTIVPVLKVHVLIGQPQNCERFRRRSGSCERIELCRAVFEQGDNAPRRGEDRDYWQRRYDRDWRYDRDYGPKRYDRDYGPRRYDDDDE
jgi:hypothetical protein